MASKIEDSIGRLSMPKVMLVGCGLAAVYYWLFFPNIDEIKAGIERNRQELTVEKEKQAVTIQAQKRQEELKEELANLSSRFAETSNRLPTEVNSSTLNKQINDIATASGGTIKVIAPKTPTMKEFIEEIPVEAVLEGSYSEIVLFLYYLATGERITRIGNFDITLGAGPTPVSGSGTKMKPVLVSLRGNAISFRFVPDAVKKTIEGVPQ